MNHFFSIDPEVVYHHEILLILHHYIMDQFDIRLAIVGGRTGQNKGNISKLGLEAKIGSNVEGR